MTPEDFKAQYAEFRRQERDTTPRFDVQDRYHLPFLNDDTPATPIPNDYVYHTAWAARVLRRINPRLHYDFSSSIQFLAVLSAWIPVKFCDIRLPSLHLDGMSLQRENLCALSFPDDSLDSVSCLHVIEHVGLGRYGDPVDYDGDLKAVRELKRIVRPGGDLLIAAPVACRSAVCFNAHRVYFMPDLIGMFADRFHIVEHALIPGPGSPEVGLFFNPADELLNRQNYGCGCLWLRKTV